MVNGELPEPVRQALVRLALHTPLRRGLDRVGEARTGGLYVLGWDESVEAVCQGGYLQTDVRVTDEDIKQLSKMDLALIISADDAFIMKASVRLTPRSHLLTPGAGARHLTAADTAREISHPVVAVSEETGAATLYTGEHSFTLSPYAVLLIKMAVAMLELESCSEKLRASDLDQRSIVTVVERARPVFQWLDTMLLEFGEEGEQFAALLSDYRMRLRDQDQSPTDGNSPAGVNAMQAVARQLADWHEDALHVAHQTLAVRPVPLAASADRPFPRIAFEHERDALQWYDQTWPSLVASIREAAEAGNAATALRRSMAMLEFFYRRKSRDAWIEVTSLAVVAARQVGDRPAEASLLTSMAIALRELRNFETAVELLERALVIWRELGDYVGAADTLNRLAYALDEMGLADRAVVVGDEALVLLADMTEPRLTGMIHNNLAGVHSRAGRDDLAMAHVGTALSLFTADDYHRGRAWALSVQGKVHHLAGRKETARDCYEEAITIRSHLGDDYGVALSRKEYGEVLLTQQDHAAARQAWNAAHDFFASIGDSHAHDIRAKLVVLDLQRLEDR